jgi:hypothetical protein
MGERKPGANLIELRDCFSQKKFQHSSIMRLFKNSKEQNLKDESKDCFASDATVRRSARRIFSKYNAIFRKSAE